MVKIVVGDATKPIGEGNKIIAHVCNDIGAWGKGFVLAVNKLSQRPKNLYKFAIEKHQIKLGDIQLVLIPEDPSIYVANMVAQHGIVKDEEGEPPIRYDSLRECLKQVYSEAKQRNATVHMPRIGCGLAGGEWNVVEKIILEELKDVQVYVYDLKKEESL